MASQGLPSPASAAGLLRSSADDAPRLFGYVVPSLEPLDAHRRALGALAAGMRLIDLNDNNVILAIGHGRAPAFRPIDVPESLGVGTRPVVTMRRSQPDIWPGAGANRPYRPAFHLLWSLGLVTVAAFFLVAAFQS